MAVRSIVLGFAEEMQTLRRVRRAMASVLFSLNPALALAIGWLVLSEAVTVWDYVGVACVVAAGIGVTWDVAHSEILPSR